MKYAVWAADTFALGPGYLISYLRSQGHEVKLIFDPLQHSHGGTEETLLSRLFSVENYNIKQVKKFKPDVCLFSCMTAHYQWALKMARRVKDEIGCKVIFGGVHPTSAPEVLTEEYCIDDFCVGEGLKYFGGEFAPDEMFPAWEDFYRELPPCHRRHPFIMTAFGCPFNCTYCQPRSLKIQTNLRSIDGCIRELKALKNLGAKRYSFWDDVLTCDKDRLFDFLGRYKKEINLPFRCLTHPRYMNFDIAARLAYAGCYTIDMGIQTGNEKLRKEVLNRHESNEDFLRASRAIRVNKITLIIDHIFEIPGESDATNRESYELYKDAKPDMIHCYKLIYFPKAKIIETALACGKLTKTDVFKINHGLGPVYASGEHIRVADINPWVKKMLALPLGGGKWEKMPDWLIKFELYRRIGKDWLPQTIIQDQLYWTWKRLLKH